MSERDLGKSLHDAERIVAEQMSRALRREAAVSAGADPEPTRPPKPPTKTCQRCSNPVKHPGRDESEFCAMHSGPLNERLAAWVARFVERQPSDDFDYGYNHAVNDIVRELRTPTPGSEFAPIDRNCVTLPNGECIGKDCMHSAGTDHRKFVIETTDGETHEIIGEMRPIDGGPEAEKMARDILDMLGIEDERQDVVSREEHERALKDAYDQGYKLGQQDAFMSEAYTRGEAASDDEDFDELVGYERPDHSACGWSHDRNDNCPWTSRDVAANT